MPNSYIKSLGVYYPKTKKNNELYKNNTFLKKGNIPYEKTSSQVVERFEQITEIKERRIALPHVFPSDMGFLAAKDAINKGKIDKESIDCIIVAHNWGDTSCEHNYSDLLPNLAARIKNKLGILNSDCVAYDILFGCPSWLEGIKQADILIKAGESKRVLVVGTDAVSRVVEPCDIDSMLFSDGAGAVVIEAVQNNDTRGILAHKTFSHCATDLDYLKMDISYQPSNKDEGLYLKMEGKKVFRYALENVPKVIIACLDKAEISITDVQYFLVHQANGKMIKAIGKKLFGSFGLIFDESKLPINIGNMGNNSVATIPTLLHELMNKQINNKGIAKGDIVVFASVGAGMHTNCIIHRF